MLGIANIFSYFPKTIRNVDNYHDNPLSYKAALFIWEVTLSIQHSKLWLWMQNKYVYVILAISRLASLVVFKSTDAFVRINKFHITQSKCNFRFGILVTVIMVLMWYVYVYPQQYGTGYQVNDKPGWNMGPFPIYCFGSCETGLICKNAFSWFQMATPYIS